MATFRITCVTSKYAQGGTHKHILTAGTTAPGTGLRQNWTVAEIRIALKNGSSFYTQSPSSGAVATVHADTCCGVETIRSGADAVTDNNLDDLPTCP